MDLTSHPVLIVMAVAVAAALLGEIRFGVLQVPVVVWEMLLGIAIGPRVFALVRADGLLEWLGKLGLAALFFMSGMDLNLQRVKGRPLNLAIYGWLLSLALGLFVATLLHLLPFIHAPIMVGLALTTTAMGVLMPILRDSGRLDSDFGNSVLGAGALGEFGPVLAVSLFLTRKFGAGEEALLTFGFAAAAIAAAFIALGVRPPRVLSLLERTMHASTQLPVCISLLILAGFDVLSERIGLEAVLGAFAAGMIVSQASRGEAGQVFREKMEAISFGFFVPFFFVVSGINLDVGSLVHSAKTMLLVPLFLALFLLVRGAPVIRLYRKDLARNERWPFALYSATALPMVVAIAAIGVRTGRMQSDVAAALMGAALLSVVLFPMIAGALLSKTGRASNSQTVIRSTY